MVSKENLNSTINGSMKPSEIPAAVVIPKSVVLEPKIPDLLQPLKIEEFNNVPIERPPTEPALPGNFDINALELNIKRQERPFLHKNASNTRSYSLLLLKNMSNCLIKW